jgi:RHS repeat-associated protein
VIDGTTLTGYIVPDNLGTPRAITDSSGTAIWRWDQVTGSTTTGGSAVFGQGSANTDPDGNGTHLTFNPRFPGQYFDAESGLHYNYFRDYEPGTGRYVQSDPIGLRGGPNTYAYARANPSRRFDSRGLWDEGGDDDDEGSDGPRTCILIGEETFSEEPGPIFGYPSFKQVRCTYFCGDLNSCPTEDYIRRHTVVKTVTGYQLLPGATICDRFIMI